MKKNRELKAISLKYRTALSTALRSNSDDARVNLRRFLKLVSETPLLREEVERAPAPAGDVMVLWNGVQNAGDRLPFPDDPLEELGLLHALLSEFAKPSENDFWHLCYRYGGITDWKECVTEVLEDVCGRYGNHLRGLLEMAAIESDDPAYDSRRIELHVSGGTNQLNLAQDHARIDASLTIGVLATEVLRLARELAERAAEAARDTGNDHAHELSEIATAVATTVQQKTPDRFTLRAAREKLELLGGTLGAVVGLKASVLALAPAAQQLAVLIGGLIDQIPK